MKTYTHLCQMIRQQTCFCLLIDPDKQTPESALKTAVAAEQNGVDIILVGGSFMVNNHFEPTLQLLHQELNIPVLIFPGCFDFVSPYADAILLLNMLSSRNPQFLIGEQLRAAPHIKKHNLEVISTGYLLIESGAISSVQYVTNSLPLPRTKFDLVVAHALAAQYLGCKLVYLEAGSGAPQPVPFEMVQHVKAAVDIPIIVGGGIRSAETVSRMQQAGAHFVVVGTRFEENNDQGLLAEMVAAAHQ